MPTLQIRRLKLLALPLLSLSFLSDCGHIRRANRESLDRFSSAYIGFRKTAYDSEVISWVVELDQSGSTDGGEGTSYRRCFVGALDAKASNRMRADSAGKGMGYYESNGAIAMDEFEARNDAADSTSLALVEAANGIQNERYRRQAVSIADSARKIAGTLGAMRSNYAALYDVQVSLLKSVSRENGDLGRSLNAMQRELPEKERLSGESIRLMNQEQSSQRELQERYAALKGMTGITTDYIEPARGEKIPSSP